MFRFTFLMLPRHLEQDGSIKTCVYYGKDRTNHLQQLQNSSLVITTYSVVRLDWVASLSESNNGLTLHSTKWGRVVLDEGMLP